MVADEDVMIDGPSSEWDFLKDNKPSIFKNPFEPTKRSVLELGLSQLNIRRLLKEEEISNSQLLLELLDRTMLSNLDNKRS